MKHFKVQIKTNYTLFLTLVVVLFFSLPQAKAQTPQTLSDYTSGETAIRGFGGPYVSGTNIGSNLGVLVGGRGGIIIGDSFSIGIAGSGFAGPRTFKGDNLRGNTSADLKVSYGQGGIVLEYIMEMHELFHLTIPISVMGAGIRVEEEVKSTSSDDDDDTDDRTVESSALFVLEPGCNIEFNVSRFFITGVHVSYRFVEGGSLTNYTPTDLSGLNVGLVFKFGNLFGTDSAK